jgi:hypothetical protein
MNSDRQAENSVIRKFWATDSISKLQTVSGLLVLPIKTIKGIQQD